MKWKSNMKSISVHKKECYMNARHIKESKRKNKLTRSKLSEVVGGGGFSASFSWGNAYANVMPANSGAFTGSETMRAVRSTASWCTNRVAITISRSDGSSFGWDFKDGTPSQDWANKFGDAATFKQLYVQYLQPLTGKAWPGWGKPGASITIG